MTILYSNIKFNYLYIELLERMYIYIWLFKYSQLRVCNSPSFLPPPCSLFFCLLVVARTPIYLTCCLQPDLQAAYCNNETYNHHHQYNRTTSATTIKAFPIYYIYDDIYIYIQYKRPLDNRGIPVLSEFIREIAERS